MRITSYCAAHELWPSARSFCASCAAWDWGAFAGDCFTGDWRRGDAVFDRIRLEMGWFGNAEMRCGPLRGVEVAVGE